jgi:uncharacterized coiled-coil protein SlyX
MNNDDQIRLESKITFVEQTVSELNEVVYAQQKEIERLKTAVKRIEERLAGGDALGDGGNLPHVKPPHY